MFLWPLKVVGLVSGDSLLGWLIRTNLLWQVFQPGSYYFKVLCLKACLIPCRLEQIYSSSSGSRFNTLSVRLTPPLKCLPTQNCWWNYNWKAVFCERGVINTYFVLSLVVYVWAPFWNLSSDDCCLYRRAEWSLLHFDKGLKGSLSTRISGSLFILFNH